VKQAAWWQPRKGSVDCRLCPRHCRIPDGEAGFCRVRKNISGSLFSLNYEECTSCALDPVEKKPLYHFYPGRSILSIGTWGCNLHCDFCQNWHIAHVQPKTYNLSPQQAVELIEQQEKNCIGIAFTYSEPTVWFEYVMDTASLCRSKGYKTVLVTNGFVDQGPLDELCTVIDAMNIDVKAFTDEFYRDICSGQLSAVLRAVERAATKCHIEITTLLVPGKNDSSSEIENLCRWLNGVNPEIPLHLSRYFPQYKMDLPATPAETMRRAQMQAKKYLRYVYIGNLAGTGSNTYCPSCGELVVDREYRTHRLSNDGKCSMCGAKIPINGEVSFLRK